MYKVFESLYSFINISSGDLYFIIYGILVAFLSCVTYLIKVIYYSCNKEEYNEDSFNRL